jgi:hypothetical protein
MCRTDPDAAGYLRVPPPLVYGRKMLLGGGA